MKNLPRVSHIDCAILRESLCACMPLAPSACCKLIPYVYWTRGLWVTSKYEGAAVRELQGAHLNSPSVLVQQEMMFQSVEERSFLKGPIDNEWGSVRWKMDTPPPPLQLIPPNVESKTEVD